MSGKQEVNKIIDEIEQISPIFIDIANELKKLSESFDLNIVSLNTLKHFIVKHKNDKKGNPKVWITKKREVIIYDDFIATLFKNDGEVEIINGQNNR